MIDRPLTTIQRRVLEYVRDHPAGVKIGDLYLSLKVNPRAAASALSGLYTLGGVDRWLSVELAGKSQWVYVIGATADEVLARGVPENRGRTKNVVTTGGRKVSASQKSLTGDTARAMSDGLQVLKREAARRPLEVQALRAHAVREYAERHPDLTLDEAADELDEIIRRRLS